MPIHCFQARAKRHITTPLPIATADTMASRRAAVFVLLDGTGGATVVVASGAKIIGVTTGAKTGVLREVIDNGLAVTVTGDARDR